MERYVFEYEPVWGVLSLAIEYVLAASPEQAKLKFLTSEAGDNCLRILRYYKG